MVSELSARLPRYFAFTGDGLFPHSPPKMTDQTIAPAPVANPLQNEVTLYAEPTPNPETMKFVTNRFLAESASYDFPDIESTSTAPMARTLFDFHFVRGVFISNNYVTVTKAPDEDWNELTPVLKDFIKNYLETGLEVISTKSGQANDASEDDSENVAKIKQILRDYVQPAIEQDGGAIQFKSFEAGKVTVMLQGSCSGCPSSTITLKAGIEGLLKRMVPEVEEVVADSY